MTGIHRLEGWPANISGESEKLVVFSRYWSLIADGLDGQIRLSCMPSKRIFATGHDRSIKGLRDCI